MKNKILPKTIPEAVDRIISKLSEKDRESLIKKRKSSLENWTIHSCLGAHVRNELGLWRENKELMNQCLEEYKVWFKKTCKKLNEQISNSELDFTSCDFSADEASGVIINAIERKLRKETT